MIAFLKQFHFLLATVVPVFALLFFGLPQWNFVHAVFALYGIPYFFVLSWMMFKENSPKTRSDMIYLFLPLVVSYVFSLGTQGFSNLQNILVLQGAPFYIGSNLAFLAGYFFVLPKNVNTKAMPVYALAAAPIIFYMVIFYMQSHTLLAGEQEMLHRTLLAVDMLVIMLVTLKNLGKSFGA